MPPSRLHPIGLRVALVCLTLVAAAWIAPARAQTTDPQYRAFWVDTYNTRVNNAAEVTAIVERARAAGANTLFVQVRRRGDAWYLNGREPRPEGVSIDAGFDPLAEMLAQGHAAGLQIHAFVVIGSIWSQATLPGAPQHVFNEHGFTPAGPRTGSQNWLTRTRLPDSSQTSYEGYRFGSDFWLDFGHPDAASYTVEVVRDLVAGYNIDGLHLDRVQYPEIGGSSDGGASVGYNEVSLERFRQHYARPAGSDPAAGDGDWSDWRRAQITALVRRIYLTVASIKPNVKISIGVVANGNAPGSEDGWRGSEAYARVFQDWRGWMEEGLLDIAVPLAFRAEHNTSEAESFASWVSWTRNHQYQRQALIGIGAYLNSIEGTLRQIRRVNEVGANPLDGVVLYSMGAHNAPVNRNPLAVPTMRDTPVRPFEDLASGLRTGSTVAGQALEPGRANASTPGATGVFGPVVSPPVIALFAAARGHVMGTIKSADGRALDTADIVLQGPDGTLRDTTDGSGFFGAIGLPAGGWRVSIASPADLRATADCSFVIDAGRVTRVDVELSPNASAGASCSTNAPARAR